VSRLHAQVREQREAIAGLHAEWARLDAPRRLQLLAERHLKLKPIDATQFESLKNLPERPPSLVPPGTSDPIGAMIEIVDPDVITGSLPSPEGPR
jgi:cell division protein FtsL